MSFYSAALYSEIVEKNALVATELHVISGYASSTLTQRILLEFPHLKISLFIGMTSTDGISLENHLGFVNLVKKYPSRIEVKYQKMLPATHIKLFCWKNSNGFVKNFVGSANFSENGLFTLKELMIDSDQDFSQLFTEQEKNSIACTDPDVYSYINIYSDDEINSEAKNNQDEIIEPDNAYFKSKNDSLMSTTDQLHNSTTDWFISKRSLISLQTSKHYDIIDIPILFKNQNIFSQRGINNIFRYGQESYLEQSVKYPFTNIFPYDTTLTFFTDDNSVLEGIFKEQYDGRLYFYSDIYSYFMNRLNISTKRPIIYSDLIKYGRDTVKIYKIKDTEYLFDFSIDN